MSQIFPDKFHYTQEQSMDAAINKWDQIIYSSMKMEGRAVTLLQVQLILVGAEVPDVKPEDAQAILNMREAWKHLFATVYDADTLEYLCQLNECIACNEAPECGKLRTGSIGISGTDYVPPVPDPETVEKELEDILFSEMTVTEKALTVFAWGARGQFFWGGNKRTSMTMANKILLAAGAGVLVIPDQLMEQFSKLLLEYYDSGSSDALKAFLYENCVQGMTI